MAFADFYSSELPENIQIAFQTLYAQLRSFVGVSFNEDGTLIPAPPGVGLSPIGTITMYGGATEPPTWLLCDGRQVSRVTYASLFNVVGTTYGVGDGSTTFNIPDLRQRFPLGKSGAGTGAILGSTGGNIDHVHTGPSHSHTLTAAGTSTTGAHSHAGTTASSGNASPGTDSQGAHSHGGNTGASSASVQIGTINATTQAVDQNLGGATVAAMTPTAVPVNAVIDSGVQTHPISSDGSHSHTVNAHNHSVTVTIASDGNHSHTLTGSTDAAGTGNTGIANPPFQVVNYIILAGV